jgi:hypothetical protein
MLFRDSQEPILKHYQEMSVTINIEHYSEMLHDKLKPMIRVNAENTCAA